MRHLRQTAQRGGGADAKALAAVGAVVGHVDGAKRRPGKAPKQRAAPFVGRIGHQQLVAFGAVLGVVSIDRGGGVIDGAQAFHMAFAKQVAALADFFHQLLEGNGFPAPFAALAHALERLQHAVRAGLVLLHGRAACAGGGAAFQAVFAAQHGVDLAHRHLHRRGVGGGQRVVGVAGNAQDAVGLGVNAHAHAALRPAAQAARRADHLAGLGAEHARDRVDAKFGQQRIAARGMRRHRARTAGDQALAGLEHHFAVTGGKGGHAASNDSAAQQQPAAGVVFRLAFGLALFVLLVVLAHGEILRMSGSAEARPPASI